MKSKTARKTKFDIAPEEPEEQVTETVETSAKRPTGRISGKSLGKKTGRSTGKSTARRSTRSKIDIEDVPKKGKGGLIALMLILLVGGAIAFFVLNKKPVRQVYLVGEKEVSAQESIKKRMENIQLTTNNLDYLIDETTKFHEIYSKAQIVMDDEKKFEYFSPNLDSNAVIKAAAVEGKITASRVKSRLKDYESLLAAQTAYDDEQLQKKREADRIADEVTRVEKEKAEAIANAAAVVAAGEALDATKDQIRWELLDVDMFEGSLFKPLEEKLKFDFVASGRRIDPWIKFKLEGQRTWGKGMFQIIQSAWNTFGILSNSGTDHIGWVFVYKKRKGVLRAISKREFKIKVVDNFDGIEIPKTLTRPIIDIPPTEFLKLLRKAILEDKLKGSNNATKKWDALKILHPDKSDAEIIDFGYACLMYCLKQFPSAKKMIKESSGISTDLLSAEIALVEPTFNRREMTTALEIANALYAVGKRQDTLMILDRLKVRFDFTPQWGEFKADYERLFNQASKLKKL